MNPSSPQGSEPRNIVLIGMPGVGKSTLGILLAKAIGYDFVDTDILIQRRAGMTLAAYLNDEGYEALRELESRVILDLSCHATVIATGGSAVYSASAMAHLASMGDVVYLRCPVETLALRIASLAERGVAAPQDQTLKDIEAERVPLYEGFADITLDVEDLDSNKALTTLVGRLNAKPSC